MAAENYYDVDMKYEPQEKIDWLKRHFGQHMYFHKSAVWAANTGSIRDYKSLLREWILHQGVCTSPRCRGKFEACLALVAHKLSIVERWRVTADNLRAILNEEIRQQREWEDQ
jgi:hypothetical protein